MRVPLYNLPADQMAGVKLLDMNRRKTEKARHSDLNSWQGSTLKSYQLDA